MRAHGAGFWSGLQIYPAAVAFAHEVDGAASFQTMRVPLTFCKPALPRRGLGTPHCGDNMPVERLVFFQHPWPAADSRIPRRPGCKETS